MPDARPPEQQQAENAAAAKMLAKWTADDLRDEFDGRQLDPAELLEWAELYGHPEAWAKRAMDLAAKLERAQAERVRYRDALETVVERATHGYQDLNSGGVLSSVRKVAEEALGDG